MSKHKNKMSYKDGLLSDAKSRISRRKKFNDNNYRLYTTCSNSKNAHAVRQKLIDWMKKHTSYSRRKQNLPVVYDTTWKGRSRFKVYVPVVWKGVPNV
jgi:hypothetical protein